MSSHQELLTELQPLEQRFENGANWFYWVAALSLINSMIGAFGGEWAFIFGLGLTQFVEGFAIAVTAELPDSEVMVRAAAAVVSLAILGAVAVVGWLSGKGITPVFLIGIVLYILDGLLFLIVADWLSVAFHAFAAFQMISGFKALGQLKRLANHAASKETQQGVMPPAVPGV